MIGIRPVWTSDRMNERTNERVNKQEWLTERMNERTNERVTEWTSGRREGGRQAGRQAGRVGGWVGDRTNEQMNNYGPLPFRHCHSHVSGLNTSHVVHSVCFTGTVQNAPRSANENEATSDNHRVACFLYISSERDTGFTMITADTRWNVSRGKRNLAWPSVSLPSLLTILAFCNKLYPIFWDNFAKFNSQNFLQHLRSNLPFYEPFNIYQPRYTHILCSMYFFTSSWKVAFGDKCYDIKSISTRSWNRLFVTLSFITNHF